MTDNKFSLLQSFEKVRKPLGLWIDTNLSTRPQSDPVEKAEDSKHYLKMEKLSRRTNLIKTEAETKLRHEVKVSFLLLIYSSVCQQVTSNLHHHQTSASYNTISSKFKRALLTFTWFTEQ